MGAGHHAEDWISEVGAFLEHGKMTRRSYHSADDGAPDAESGALLYRPGQDASGRVRGALGGPVAPVGERAYPSAGVMVVPPVMSRPGALGWA
jgi:hypothetical protein